MSGISEIAYEPPAIAEVGDFTEVTMGNPSWGFDNKMSCLKINCG